MVSGRREAILKWARNVLLAAGLVSLFFGQIALSEVRQKAEEEPPVPVAIADPWAQPLFSEPAAGDVRFGNCLACHPAMLGADQAGAASLPQVTGDGDSAAASAEGTATLTKPPRATPTRPPTASPSAPLKLLIPGLNLDSSIVAVGPTVKDGQTIWEVPRDVVGWYRATALAGAPGNVVLSGHMSQQIGLGIFRDLYQLRVDDVIYVETATQRLTYTVRDVRIVLPAETGYLKPTPDTTLTMITCAGHFDLVTRTYSHRLIVTAKLQGVVNNWAS